MFDVDIQPDILSSEAQNLFGDKVAFYARENGMAMGAYPVILLQMALRAAWDILCFHSLVPDLVFGMSLLAARQIQGDYQLYDVARFLTKAYQHSFLWWNVPNRPCEEYEKALNAMVIQGLVDKIERETISLMKDRK